MNGSELSFLSESPAATRRLAAIIALNITAPVLIALNGPLGAGKTEFVRGFAETFGLEDSVASPTFVLENIYRVRQETLNVKEICHWDLYRVGQKAQIAEVLEQLDREGGVILVEWADLLPELRKAAHLAVFFSCADERDSERVIRIECAASQQRVAVVLQSAKETGLSLITEQRT